jgi:hypothetical protein
MTEDVVEGMLKKANQVLKAHVFKTLVKHTDEFNLTKLSKGLNISKDLRF